MSLLKHGTTPIIVLSLATNREDKGQTENYRVFGGGGTMTVKNKRGEAVGKNVILGSNGTVYIGNEVANGHDQWVLVPKKFFDQVMRSQPAPNTLNRKKGKK